MTTGGARRLYLIRHGETELSVRRCYSGRRDVPLTERGQEQARLAGQRLCDAGLDAVYSSPLSRATQTARVIAEAASVPLLVDERLVEVDYGPLEGMDRDGARQHFGVSYTAWRADPMGVTLPGAEPLREALTRTASVTREAIGAWRCPVLVAHQGILRLVLIALGRIGPDDYFGTRLAEAEPIELSLR